MQFQNTEREPEMAELIEGPERDRRRLAELLDGIRVGPEVDVMADGMREAVWADVRGRIRRPGNPDADRPLCCGCGRGGGSRLRAAGSWAGAGPKAVWSPRRSR